MPYISPEERTQLDPLLKPLAKKLQDLEVGATNYAITKLAWNLWLLNPRYKSLALVAGVLDNVKDEFYRCVAAPYEDAKRAANGDVYREA